MLDLNVLHSKDMHEVSQTKAIITFLKAVH